MSLRDVMAELVTLEQGLAITAPVAISGANKIKAYKIAPARSTAIVNQITFMNWPDAGDEARLGNQREDSFTVQIDCLVKDADLAQAADIALAFFDALWTALDAQKVAGTRLNGKVDFLTLRAMRPLFETIEWAGQGYPGFHIFTDLTIFKGGL